MHSVTFRLLALQQSLAGLLYTSAGSYTQLTIASPYLIETSVLMNSTMNIREMR